jgi:hypothetical protein
MKTRNYMQYGLTAKQWDRMYKLQEGKCPICQRPIYRPGNKEGKRAAAVDHDHRTGRVRGLLDYRCNRYIIGRNSAERAERVYRYLVSTFDGREL